MVAPVVAELPPPVAAFALVVVGGGDVDPGPGGPSRRSEDRVRAWTPSEDISLMGKMV